MDIYIQEQGIKCGSQGFMENLKHNSLTKHGVSFGTSVHSPTYLGCVQEILMRFERLQSSEVKTIEIPLR